MREALFLLALLVRGCDAAPGPSYERDAFAPTTDMGPASDAEPMQMADQGEPLPSDSALPDAEVTEDSAVTDQGAPPETVDLDAVDWPQRVCSVRIAHCEQANALVRLAGDFTCNEAGACWADGAWP